MRPIKRILPLLTLTGMLSAGAIACSAIEPTAIQTGPDGGSSTGTFKPPPPVDMAEPDDGRVAKPTLDAIPAITESSTVPIHGTGEPGSTVLIESSEGNAVAADVQPTGRFCVDLPLKKSTVNHFELRALDLNGNQSDPAKLQVEQRGEPEAPSSTPRPALNMAIGGTVATTLDWNTGAASALVDGNASTAAGSWQRSWATTDNVVVRLSGRRQIDKVRLRAPDDCPLTVPFKLYSSNLDAPSPPNVMPMAWTLLNDYTEDAGTDRLFTLHNSLPMTHVAVMFDRGFIAWGDEDLNCGNSFFGAYYSFSEIQALSVANSIPPVQNIPSCGGGG